MNLSSGAAMIVLGVAVAVGVDTTAEKISPNARSLVLEQLSYENGYFTQRVAPTYGGGLRAEWIAEVSRTVDGVTQQLCVGSGEAPYKGTTDTYSADDWTGDDCPDLQAGDVAEAIWTWEDEKGRPRSISASLVIE